MTTIVAVRHGETAWNREGRMQGWAPVPLNDTGHQQAAAAADLVADRYDVDHVHTSDLLRTEQTAEAFVDALPLGEADVHAERAWRERDIGAFQGLTYDDVFDRFPEFALGEEAAQAAERRPESGESLVDVYDRVTGRFEEVLAEAGPDETRLVVTHGGPIYLLLGHVKDVPIPDALLSHTQHNCSINEFRHDPDTGETWVERENELEWEDGVEA